MTVNTKRRALLKLRDSDFRDESLTKRHFDDVVMRRVGTRLIKSFTTDLVLCRILYTNFMDFI